MSGDQYTGRWDLNEPAVQELLRRNQSAVKSFGVNNFLEALTGGQRGPDPTRRNPLKGLYMENGAVTLNVPLFNLIAEYYLDEALSICGSVKEYTELIQIIADQQGLDPIEDYLRVKTYIKAYIKSSKES